MPSLRELQTAFREALILDDERGIRAQILPDGLDAAARVAVYRHHVLASLATTLAATYPVVCRLVDRRFFGWLADNYVRQHPPSGPCLFEYGGDFAAFIERFPACAALPWLADVARLEWAMNAALHAPDARPLAPDRLAAMSPETLAQLVVELDPSVTLLSSSWPVDGIWRANQHGAEPVPVDLDAGPVRLEIRRRGDDVVFRALPAGAFAFRRTLAEQAPLEQAVKAAVAADLSFDLTAEIRAVLDEELLVD
jgi:hypothetical protein